MEATPPVDPAAAPVPDERDAEIASLRAQLDAERQKEVDEDSPPSDNAAQAPPPSPDQAPESDAYHYTRQVERLRDDFAAGRVNERDAVTGIIALLGGEDVPYIGAEKSNEPA